MSEKYFKGKPAANCEKTKHTSDMQNSAILEPKPCVKNSKFIDTTTISSWDAWYFHKNIIRHPLAK